MKSDFGGHAEAPRTRDERAFSHAFGTTPSDTLLPGLEKPHVAAPVTTECGEPAAFARGPVYQAGPLPIPTTDDAMLLADEIIKNPLQSWRNQADGFFE